MCIFKRGQRAKTRFLIRRLIIKNDIGFALQFLPHCHIRCIHVTHQYPLPSPDTALCNCSWVVKTHCNRLTKKKKLEHRSKPHALAVSADNLDSNADSHLAPHTTTAHLHHCTIHKAGQRALRRFRRRQVVHKLSFVDQCIFIHQRRQKKKATNERQFKNSTFQLHRCVDPSPSSFKQVMLLKDSLGRYAIVLSMLLSGQHTGLTNFQWMFWPIE